jgi:hypothetical protein
MILKNFRNLPIVYSKIPRRAGEGNIPDRVLKNASRRILACGNGK